MLSGKHKLPVPLDMAANSLPAAPQGMKFHQDLVGEGPERRGSWAHIAWEAARARLLVSPRCSGRDPDVQAAAWLPADPPWLLGKGSTWALSCSTPANSSASTGQQRDSKLLSRNCPLSPSQTAQECCSLAKNYKISSLRCKSCEYIILILFLESSCLKLGIKSIRCLR